MFRWTGATVSLLPRDAVLGPLYFRPLSPTGEEQEPMHPHTGEIQP